MPAHKKKFSFTPQQKVDCILWSVTMTPDEIRSAYRKKYGSKGYVPGGKLPSNKDISDWTKKLKETGSVNRKPMEKRAK
jgi:hypothetical protein